MHHTGGERSHAQATCTFVAGMVSAIQYWVAERGAHRLTNVHCLQEAGGQGEVTKHAQQATHMLLL